MAISNYINASIERSSWIRKMFEEGALLKSKYGEENVFDFSLGNPDLDPPSQFLDVLMEFIKSPVKGNHGYMPNAGYPDVCQAIAKKVSSDHDVTMPGGHIVMTCGAAGGLNVIFKTLLNPGDEVIVPKPYFVEYGFYIENHQGKMILAETNEDFGLNISRIEDCLTAKTKAILLNSPHNPTGVVYTLEQITSLAKALEEYCRKTNQVIYLISDEPYRDIVYDDIRVPSILKYYKNSIVTTSYSKTLSIPGERIGYIAVNPEIDAPEKIMAGLILSNRILGFVNAPGLMQRAVARLNEISVNVNAYKRRRDILIEGLKFAGYSFAYPNGAFYVFCKSPIPDDVAYVKHLLKFNILVVPGVGFGGPGYFRIAYCVPESVISRAIPKFKEALETH